MADEQVVAVRKLRHVYPDGTTLNYTGPDFLVHRGERVALLGSNGSGKSTLLFHILGLLRPTEGEVRVFGYDPAREFDRIRRRIGVLFQDPDEQIIAPTVREDIGFSPRNYGYPPAEVDRMVQEIAADLGISDLLDKVPHYLSGGQRLKLALAGALVLKPDLLVLDEPFEGLDAASREDLVVLLNRLHRERGVSMVVTVHDVDLAPHFVDTVYLLGQGGAIVEKGSPHHIFSEPELLIAHRLEPPVLSLLFAELRRRGIAVEPAFSVLEAADRIEQAFGVRGTAGARRLPRGG